MITKVKLKNWRSHLESELIFSGGTNALLGSMGAGKTSVLDSICFGLFGIFPNLQSKKLKLDDVIMKKPIEKSRAEVEVHFELDGKHYSIRRVIDKGKGTSYSEFREDGSLVEAPNSQRVTELVEKTLKIDYDLFSKAIYSEQNGLDYFLTVPKGQRMKKIDELLMIDRFEKARSSSVSLINKLVDRKIGKQSIIDQIDIEKLEGNISALKGSLEDMISQKNQFLDILSESSDQRKNLEKEFNELKKIKDGLELLKREEKGVNSAIEETLKAVKSLEDALKGQSKENIEKEISELNMKIKEFEEKKDAIQGNYDEINSIVSEFKTKINFLKKDKLSKLEKEIEEKVNIKNEIEQLKKQFGPDISKLINERKLLYEGFIGDIQELKTKIIDLDEVLQQLSSLEGRCPICESILTEERKKTLIEQKQKLINELKIRLEESIKNKELSEVEINNIELAVKKLGEMVVEIKNFDSLIEDFENSKKLFLELSEKLIEVENQLSQFKKELSGIEIRLKEATDKKQQFKILSSKLEDYSIRRDRFNELMKESKHFEVKISEMEQKISGRDFASMEYQLRELIKKEKEAETKIQSFDQLMEEKNSRIREYEKNLNEAIEHKKEIEKLDKIIKDLKIFEEALKHTQTELRTEFVEAVNYTMNKIWSALYPYQDFVGVNLAIEDGDYVLKLQERSRSYVNADGIASGGERSIACLALRIAFSLVLAPHMRMLILDEPTANLDSRAVAELATTLRERVCEFIDQTFLITHQAELEDAVTGNAYRIERDKENDGVTKIVAVS